MNDKFWDLNKSKQDNMIGSAVKVFALNGFGHASTDEIVAEASVSKGPPLPLFSEQSRPVLISH